MQSKATTVKQYLSELPADRRAAIEVVRKIILANLDKVYEEGIQYGVIGYFVPHKIYPNGYHCDPKQPLPFAGLASQKNYMSLYLMYCYGGEQEEDWFRAQWAKTGKKLDMGKCCVRFKRLEDLALDVIAETIARVPARKYIEQYETLLKSQRIKKKPSKAATSKPKAVATTQKLVKKSKPAKKVPLRKKVRK